MKLWENDSLDLYVRLLRDDYWQTHILNSIAIWLANDLEAVQNVLVEPIHMSNIIEFFRSAPMKTIHSIHKPLLDMMNKSSDLCKAFSCSGLFISSLIKRLSTANEAIVLRSLLRMLQLIHQHHPSPRQLVLDLNLYHIVLKFVQDSSQVLVYQAAVLVLKDFQNSTIS
jgi:predicted transcriptional regulator